MTLKSIQRDAKDKTVSELNTEIDYATDGNGGFVIAYEESETTGMEGSRMQIRVTADNTVYINRTGNFQTDLVVCAGQKYFSNYETPFGEFMVGVKAQFVRSFLTENGGHLALRYTVDANSTLLSDNEIIVDVKRYTAQEE
jgi:uncharacterized beta-barrel protein YwiB (DUF1934 family)